MTVSTFYDNISVIKQFLHFFLYEELTVVKEINPAL